MTATTYKKPSLFDFSWLQSFWSWLLRRWFLGACRKRVVALDLVAVDEDQFDGEDNDGDDGDQGKHGEGKGQVLEAERGGVAEPECFVRRAQPLL